MSNFSLFLKQVLKNPKEVSAVAPSSKKLATRMAKAIPDGLGQVVELGAGTGMITDAILEAGVAPHTLYSFEINETFIDY